MRTRHSLPAVLALAAISFSGCRDTSPGSDERNPISYSGNAASIDSYVGKFVSIDGVINSKVKDLKIESTRPSLAKPPYNEEYKITTHHAIYSVTLLSGKDPAKLPVNIGLSAEDEKTFKPGTGIHAVGLVIEAKDGANQIVFIKPTLTAPTERKL